jgi:hypothetical protein
MVPLNSAHTFGNGLLINLPQSTIVFVCSIFPAEILTDEVIVAGNALKIGPHSWVLWYMSVISATQEAEAGG